MANRRSPRRIAKAAKIARWASLPESALPKRIPHAAIARLETDIIGEVVLPADAHYERARLESNEAFQRFPQLVVYCEHATDVARALKFAQDHALWIAVRSGGHSTAGYSVNDGLVIDVSRIRYVRVPGDEAIAQVGPGTDFDTLNAALDLYELHVPGGACGNVCVGGFMQGGGYGYTSRKFGMNCDNVLAVTIMLCDGRIVVANDTQYSDLFWAVRGGTGGNFGVLLEIEYRAHRLPSAWGWAIEWNIDDAAAVLAEIQAKYTRTGAPPELGFYAHMNANPQGAPRFLAHGIYVRDPAAGKAALASLLAIGSAKLVVDKTALYGALDKLLDHEPYPVPIMPPGLREDKQTTYIDRPLGREDWQKFVDYYVTTEHHPANIFVIEPYGGAINAYAPDGNAFVHRNVDMNVYVDTFWDGEDGSEARVWLDDFMAIILPYGNGQVYQNYPRASLRDFQRAYWGPSFERLLEVKRKYDPHNVFHYEQSVAAEGA